MYVPVKVGSSQLFRQVFMWVRILLNYDDYAEKFEELVASTPSQKNWKGILIALLVIGFVCALIILSVVLLTPLDPGPRFSGSRLTLEDILGDSFKPPAYRSEWVSKLSGSEVMFRDETGGISLLDVNTLTSKRYVQEFTYRRLDVKEFWMSAKKQYILFRHDAGKNGHQNHLSRYTVMDMNTEQVDPVTPFPSASRTPELLQLVEWLPDSESLLMVYQNDLYLKQSPTASEVFRITDNGEMGVIFNGVTDHLYREYILHQTSAIWVDPGLTYLCYASFNDSLVPTVSIPLYFTPQYSTLKNIRYPKVDSPNPVATLWVVKLEDIGKKETLEKKDLKPPMSMKDEDHYFTDVQWIEEDSIAVTWRNRAQNVSVATICTEPLWFCQEVISETTGRRHWVLMNKVPIFGHNVSEFVTTLPLTDGSHGSYTHVHQGHVNTHHFTPITYGQYTVFSVVLWDTENNYVYYVANTETETAERHLWRVTDINSEEARVQECLTCGQNYSNLHCRHYVPSFSAGSKDKILLHCEGPSVPHTVIYSIPDGEFIYGVQLHTALREMGEGIAWPQQKDFELQLEGDFVARIRILYPPETIENEGIPHPTIVFVSGVPGQQGVNYRWGADFNTYLSSNKSWIVVYMDVRGSGGEELTREFQPAWNLGHYESLDYLSITKYLSENYDTVDERRIGVVGIGHGGHNALRMLAYDSGGVITCAAAINPITDWKNYASFYSEKLMGTARVVPDGNFRGYEDSTLLTKGRSFVNKSFVIIHGTADSDVLYSHTMKFSKELIDQGARFRQQSYTDEEHDLDAVRFHLYRSLEEYFTGCFPPFEDDELEAILGS